MKWIALAALGLLSACGRPAPAAAPAAPEPAPKPAPVVMDLSQPMTATGTEPFWSLKIEGTRFTLTRLGHPDVAANAPGAQVTPGLAVWQAKTTDGRPLKVTFYLAECSDGMSDRRYPMTAEIETAQGLLHGCAAKTADRPSDPASQRP